MINCVSTGGISPCYFGLYKSPLATNVVGCLSEWYYFLVARQNLPGIIELMEQGWV